MNKADLASYLVSLHTLMEAQSKAVVSVPSTVLADEYNKHWDLLKQTILKENDDGSKNIRNASDVDEGRANLSRNKPWRGLGDWEYGRPEPHPSR